VRRVRGRPRVCRLTLHFGEFTADWSAAHDEDYGVFVCTRMYMALCVCVCAHKFEEKSVNKITQKMRKRVYTSQAG